MKWLIIPAIILFSCTSTPGPQIPKEKNPLAGRSFEWISGSVLSKKDSLPFPGNKPRLTFGDSNALKGYTGCNMFFGKYEWSPKTIKLRMEGMTKMFCMEVNEVDFLEHLKRIHKLRFSQDLLILYASEKDSSIWKITTQ